MPRATTPPDATHKRARRVLLHVLGDDARNFGTPAYARLMAGLAYAIAADPRAMDTTLEIDSTMAVARRILREGATLTEAGLELSPCKTEPPARAWAIGKLDSALNMLLWHPKRIERDRYFVRAALRRIAMTMDCAVVLLSHPSLTGMQSGSGLSGSTAWNNSVRSRLYLTSPDDRDGDSDSRLLSTMKSNYGPKGGKIGLRWSAGCFVLDDGKPSAAAGILNRIHDDAFLQLLSDVNRTGQRVGATRGTNYAPAILADMPAAKGHNKKQLEASMRRLLDGGVIKVVWDGPPSKQRQRLILAAEDFGPADE